MLGLAGFCDSVETPCWTLPGHFHNTAATQVIAREHRLQGQNGELIWRSSVTDDLLIYSR